MAYLVSMLIFEIIAYFFGSFSKGRNTWVYNFLTLVEFNFLLFFLRDILLFTNTKKYINYFIIGFNAIYFLTSIFYLFNNTYLITYNSIASISGGVFITLSVFLFFKDFINSDKILNFKKSLPFWISVGLLIYYLGSIPATLMMNAFQSLKRADHSFILSINPFLALLMYSIFIFGALWSQKKEL
ncbi:hypothetical protein [Polaribacter sp. BM10]|uniref:hypothetical protein n=1 Tax=Polaribacter sp. BM10 TaxID=1529069 RepID=UPI0011EA5529|nr:hypothetical protein [Polaribacter sp. BM10]